MKTIPGFDNRYAADKNGVIYRLPYKVKQCNGRDYSIKEKIMTPTITACGYLKIMLTKDYKQRTKLVHVLIARTFIQNPVNKPFVNHINGNKLDNRVENLEWCTQKENIHHSIKIGTRGKGNAKLSKRDVLFIRKALNRGIRGKDLAKHFNVAPTTICMISTNKNWKDLK